MQILLEFIYIWLPACLALVSLGWFVSLSRRVRRGWQMVVHVLLAIVVVYLFGCSLWALYGIRFLDWWPTYLPYIFVGAALAVSGAWHVALRRRVVV